EGDKLYAGNGSLGSVTELTVSDGQISVARKIELFPNDPAGSPHLIADIVQQQGRLLVADNAQDKILVVEARTREVLQTIACVRNPYAMLLSEDGKSVFVSSWSTAQIAEYSLADGHEIAAIPVGPHPTEMVWLSESRLAVACANTNHVFVLSKGKSNSWKT